MSQAPNPPQSPAQPARAPIRLTAQVLTCVVFSLCALLIIFVAQAEPLSVFRGPMSVGEQLLVGLGLSALAVVASYASFRLTAQSEATKNTIIAYGRRRSAKNCCSGRRCSRCWACGSPRSCSC
jgi:hypothetical protein